MTFTSKLSNMLSTRLWLALISVADISTSLVIVRTPATERPVLCILTKPAKLRNLLAPFPASEMISHAVGYDVNHPKIDDEHLLWSVEPNLGYSQLVLGTRTGAKKVHVTSLSHSEKSIIGQL